jgi:general secretion pathway protein C
MPEQKSYLRWQQHLKEQGLQRLIPLLSLLLILVAAQSAARLSWRLLDFTTPQPTNLAATTGPVSQVAPPELAALNSDLVDLHLFGLAGRVKVEALTDASDLPATTLDLALIGVIFSTSPGKSVAIIGAKGKTTANEIYSVGDKLPGAAVLSEIHPDRVILRRGGRYETLAIEEPGTLLNSPQPKKIGLKQKGRQHQIKPRGDGVNWSINRSYLDQRLANMNSLASEVGADIYQKDGVQQGFQLRANNKSRLLDELGLQSGDVLTEVNGMPLRSPSDAMRAFAKTKNAENVSVEIIRDGTRQTRKYRIGQL